MTLRAEKGVQAFSKDGVVFQQQEVHVKGPYIEVNDGVAR
jgi:hypothetical protein